MAVLKRSGTAKAFAPEHLLMVRGRRFEALEVACERARERIEREGKVVERPRPIACSRSITPPPLITRCKNAISTSCAATS
jgi:hypothetical protein